MRLPFELNQKRAFIPPGKPRINWNHPITAGLLACYVPSGSGKIIYNLTGKGGDLTLAAGALYGQTSEGQGLKSTAATNNEWASVTAPANFKLTDNMSLYWRGLQVALNTTNTDIYIGLSPPGVSPFSDYMIAASNLATSDVGAAWNSANTGTNSATTFTPTANTMGSYGATFKVGGNTLFYNNGSLFDTTAFGASAPTYGGTDNIVMGGYPGAADGRTPGIITTIGCIWNRILTAAEMAYIDKNPYAFLVFPDDELFATTSSAASVTVSLSGSGPLTLGGNIIGVAYGLINGALTLTGEPLGTGALIPLSNGALTLAGNIIGTAYGLQKGSLALTGQSFFASPIVSLGAGSLNLSPSNIGVAYGLKPSALTLTGDALGTLNIVLVQLFAFPLLLSGQFMGTYPVTVNVGGRILLNHFNNLVAPINTVLGTGTGDVGYGQSGLLTQTTYNAPIQFETMQQTVTKLTNHQGTSNPPAALNTYNARITAADVNSLSTIVQSLQPNRFLTGLTSMALISSAVTSTRATSWSTTITATWNVTFADEDHCRWFFNSSGAVRVNLTHPTTAAPDVEFSAFVANKVGTISFNHSATTQAATTPLGTPAALGYYQLTDSLQTIYTATDTSGGAYSADACQIQAKRLSFVGTRGGNGSGVQFVITLTTAHGTLVSGTELFVGYKIATTFLTMTAPTVTLITGF